MKDKMYAYMKKFIDLCDSGKPWYFFLGMWTTLLMADILCQLFANEKPKWWNWVVVGLGYLNVFLNLRTAKRHREEKAAEADV